jgi:hypothetical protein
MVYIIQQPRKTVAQAHRVDPPSPEGRCTVTEFLAIAYRSNCTTCFNSGKFYFDLGTEFLFAIVEKFPAKVAPLQEPVGIDRHFYI